MIRVYIQQGSTADGSVVYSAHGLIPGQELIITLVDTIRRDGKGAVNWIISRRGDAMSIRRMDLIEA